VIEICEVLGVSQATVSRANYVNESKTGKNSTVIDSNESK
jgi:hypothetical protein